MYIPEFFLIQPLQGLLHLLWEPHYLVHCSASSLYFKGICQDDVEYLICHPNFTEPKRLFYKTNSSWNLVFNGEWSERLSGTYCTLKSLKWSSHSTFMIALSILENILGPDSCLLHHECQGPKLFNSCNPQQFIHSLKSPISPYSTGLPPSYQSHPILH